MTEGVNFDNILQVVFPFWSFSVLRVFGFVIFWQKEIGAKAVQKNVIEID